jgi:hypothetical protein
VQISTEHLPITGLDASHTVKWVRDGDGFRAVFISGGMTDIGAGNDVSELDLFAQVPGINAPFAGVTIQAVKTDPVYGSSVSAQADGNVRLVLSGTNKSNFVSQMQPAKAFVAVVYVVGTTGAVFYSSQVGISVVRNAVGIYTVSWPVGFPSSAPAGVVMPQIQPSTGGGCIGSQYLVAAPTSAQYATFPGNGIASDSDHSLFFWIA